MRIVLLAFMFFQLSNQISAQGFTAELMPGNHYLFYQHVMNQKLKENGKASIIHIANISNWYEQNPTKGGMRNELMNQAYIGLQAGGNITIMGGLFYANVTGMRPAVAVQFVHTFKDGLLVLVPRADVINNGSVEVMGMFEFQPSLTKKLKLYSRVQLMSNIGPYHHNRSYQRVRLGVDIKKMQAGFAVNVNEYGYPVIMKLNTGLFLRKAF